MSYYDPELVTRWRVCCRSASCAYVAQKDLKSAGEAERIAMEHLTDDQHNTYSHEVEITSYTLLTRNP